MWGQQSRESAGDQALLNTVDFHYVDSVSVSNSPVESNETKSERLKLAGFILVVILAAIVILTIDFGLGKVVQDVDSSATAPCTASSANVTRTKIDNVSGTDPYALVSNETVTTLKDIPCSRPTNPVTKIVGEHWYIIKSFVNQLVIDVRDGKLTLEELDWTSNQQFRFHVLFILSRSTGQMLRCFPDTNVLSLKSRAGGSFSITWDISELQGETFQLKSRNNRKRCIAAVKSSDNSHDSLLMVDCEMGGNSTKWYFLPEC